MDPGVDFTRNRKLNASQLMYFLLHLNDRPINSFLMNWYDSIEDMPSASAITQQRQKLDPEALERVFHLFTDGFENYKTYKGFYILACDGSDINISHNANDKETYHISTTATKGYNQLHLNALFDVLNGVYHDVNIDTASKTNECNALIEMIRNGRYPSNSIIICDRGYEKYLLIAVMLESNQKFVIRVKDITSNGILSTLKLPDKEFDMNIKKIVTRVNNSETANDGKYAVLMNNNPFDFIDFENEYYEMDLRAVRFKITDDNYECLITNLTEEEMAFEEFKDVYHLRWREENAFRDLKYTIGMLYFHSSNQRLIRQEIFASLIMYNFCSIMANNVGTEENQSEKWKYKTNFKTAVTNIRRYLRNEIDEEELILRLKKILIPIRPGRTFSRRVRAQSAKTPSYYTA